MLNLIKIFSGVNNRPYLLLAVTELNQMASVLGACPL